MDKSLFSVLKGLLVGGACITLVFFVFRDRQSLIHQYFNQTLSCHSSSSASVLKVLIIPGKNSNEITVQAEGFSQTSLGFLEVGPFAERYSNEAGQEIFLYDSDLDMHKLFNADSWSCYEPDSDPG